MNVVLMTSRSGSSLVCKILAAHGLRWQHGKEFPEQVRRGEGHPYATYENHHVKEALRKCSPGKKWPMGKLLPVTNKRLDILKHAMLDENIDFVKSGVEFAELWAAWGEVICERINFVKVYRPPQAVADSFVRRGIGEWQLAHDTAQARFRLMDDIPGHWVYTHKLASGNFYEANIQRAVMSCGAIFDADITDSCIKRGIFHGQV